MDRNNFILSKLFFVLLILTNSIFFNHLRAQSGVDTLNGRNLYRPYNMRHHDTNNTTLPAKNEVRERFVNDTSKIRMKLNRDSIEAREDLVRDSLAKREAFVQDSIRKRQLVLDSLNFLKARLPGLLDATILTLTDQIVVHRDNIEIVGDSMLSDYICRILPFDLTQPYTPWKTIINLSDKPEKITRDKEHITSIQTSLFSCSFDYAKNDKIIIIHPKATIENRQTGRLYSFPIDSVFYDPRGNIVKIKKYVQFYKVTANYQRGAALFLYLAQVKQFEYQAGQIMPHYQIVNFCKRWTASDPKNICNILNYSIAQQNNNYILTRKMNPANGYSDGTYTFEFDNQHYLKSVAFKNVRNSEDRKTFIDHNKEGYVSRYVYKVDGSVHETLLVNYYLNDPTAKYKVETITCTFENDGASYYQRNNMTGKSRTRSKLTGEWTPWQ